MKKNIGLFKSHICQNCSNFPKGKNASLVKLCNSCDAKTSMLEDVKKMDVFELFNLNPTFNIDIKQIDREYKALQKIVHPDMITALKDKDVIKEAENVSAFISRTYETLRDDYSRARYFVR